MDDRKNTTARQPLTFIMATISILMWSTNLPATRYLLAYYSPGSIALLRSVGAVVLLCLIGALKRIRLPKMKDLHMFVICGVSGVFLFLVFQTLGARHVVSGVGSFIINSSPVFTIILATILLKERVKPVCWAGVVLSFCGLMVIMVNQTTEFSFNIGVFFLLLTSIVTSIFNISQRSLLKSYTFLEVVTYAIIAATICMTVFIPGTVPELAGSNIAANLMLLYLGLFPGALAHLTWTYALSRAEKTTHVTVFLYLTPFVATVIGYFWLDETFSLWSFFGGVVIVAGMAMTNLLGRTQKH